MTVENNLLGIELRLDKNFIPIDSCGLLNNIPGIIEESTMRAKRNDKIIKHQEYKPNIYGIYTTPDGLIVNSEGIEPDYKYLKNILKYLPSMDYANNFINGLYPPFNQFYNNYGTMNPGLNPTINPRPAFTEPRMNYSSTPRTDNSGDKLFVKDSLFFAGRYNYMIKNAKNINTIDDLIENTVINDSKTRKTIRLKNYIEEKINTYKSWVCDFKQVLKNFINNKSSDKKVEIFKALGNEVDGWLISVTTPTLERKAYINVKGDQIEIRVFPKDKTINISGKNIDPKLVEKILLEEIENFKKEDKGE
jgi:hypothetical protein